ncbi:MAG: hypothetical protein ACYDEA_04540 [Candidatus Dormibacteria bacterium]
MIKAFRHRRLLMLLALVVLFLAFFAILPPLTFIVHILIGLAIIWLVFALVRSRR